MATVYKAGRVPGVVRDFAMNGTSVSEALSTAGITLGAGESVTLNAETVTSDAFARTTVREGSTLLVSKQVKGN